MRQKMFMKVFLLFLTLVYNISCSDFDKQYASLPEIFHMDNYDSCMMRGDEALYCYFRFTLEPINIEDPPEMWNFIQNLSLDTANYDHADLKHLICVPHTCPGVNLTDRSLKNLENGLEQCYNEKYKHMKLKGTVKEIECQTTVPQISIDNFDILVGILLVLYVSFVLIATSYEVYASHQSLEEYNRILSTRAGKVLFAFSISKNWTRLTTVNYTPENKKFMALQGIRFYNSMIVVFAHTALGYIATPVSNTRYAELMPQRAESIFFGSGHLCLTTFFFISSFLLAYGLFTHAKDKKVLEAKTLLFVFIYRLMRLLPVLIFMILYHSTWLYHLGSGPFWNKMAKAEHGYCRKNGWTNLLFINNLVDSKHMCLPTTWFLALATQYFIISLIYIWIIKKYEKYAWHIMGAGIAYNIIGTFIHNYYHDFPCLTTGEVPNYFGLYDFLNGDQFQIQLGSFVGNFAGPAFGTIFGYFLCKWETENPSKKLFSTKFRHFLFYLSITIGIGSLVVPGIVILYWSNEHDRFWSSVYVALSRPAIAIFVGTFVFGCSEGLGWLGRRVCEWPPTCIMSRLTYSAYLVHMSICLMRPSMSRGLSYMSTYFIVNRFFGDIFMTYIAATLLTLFVELPFSALQKQIFSQDKKIVKSE